MKKNNLINKVRQILALKGAIKKTSNDKETIESSVKLWFDTKDLRKRLESTLKSEWKLDEIDDDLDFDLDDVSIKWHFYVRKYSNQSYGEIVLECPDQKIKISGKALYTVEESKSKRFMDDELSTYKDLEYSFEFEIDANNISVEALRDFKLENGSFVEAKTLEFIKNKWSLELGN